MTVVLLYEICLQKINGLFENLKLDFLKDTKRSYNNSVPYAYLNILITENTDFIQFEGIFFCQARFFSSHLKVK